MHKFHLLVVDAFVSSWFEVHTKRGVQKFSGHISLSVWSTTPRLCPTVLSNKKPRSIISFNSTLPPSIKPVSYLSPGFADTSVFGPTRPSFLFKRLYDYNLSTTISITKNGMAIGFSNKFPNMKSKYINLIYRKQCVSTYSLMGISLLYLHNVNEIDTIVRMICISPLHFSIIATTLTLWHWYKY